MGRICFFGLLCLLCCNLAAIPMDEERKENDGHLQQQLNNRNRTDATFDGDPHQKDVPRGSFQQMALEEKELIEEDVQQESVEEQVRSLMIGFGFTEEEASNLNQCLKKLQHSLGPVSHNKTCSIIWNNASQKFEEFFSNNNNNNNVAINNNSNVDIGKVISTLNAYLDEKRSECRLDSYS